MDTHQVVWNEKIAQDIIKHLQKRRMEGMNCKKPHCENRYYWILSWIYLS
jgi:hypothetical protein